MASKAKGKAEISKLSAAPKSKKTEVKTIAEKPPSPKPAPASPVSVASAAAVVSPVSQGQALGKAPADVVTLVKSSNRLLKEGNIGEARKIATDLIRMYPSRPEGHVALAGTFASEKNYDEASRHMQTAAELNSADELALEKLANFQLKARDWDGARKTIYKIMEKGPTDRSLIWAKDKINITTSAAADPFMSLTADVETLWELGQFLARRPTELLKLPSFRQRLGRQRRYQMVKSNGVTLLEETDDVIRNAVVHNYDYLESSSDDGGRPNLLINPLAAIDYVYNNAATMKVLTIGPRSETEIFCLMAAGFQLENITGVDLISFSPLIKSGDMHNLPFDDNSFDVVIGGWVLAYSTNNPKAASEMLRVARPNAYFAIGCAFTPPTRSKGTIDREGKNIVGTRFSDVHDILQHFEGHIKQVYFRGEVERERRLGTAAVTAVFQVKANY